MIHWQGQGLLQVGLYRRGLPCVSCDEWCVMHPVKGKEKKSIQVNQLRLKTPLQSFAAVYIHITLEMCFTVAMLYRNQSQFLTSIHPDIKVSPIQYWEEAEKQSVDSGGGKESGRSERENFGKIKWGLRRGHQGRERRERKIWSVLWKWKREEGGV